MFAAKIGVRQGLPVVIEQIEWGNGIAFAEPPERCVRRSRPDSGGGIT